jgi:hypothetical protein
MREQEEEEEGRGEGWPEGEEDVGVGETEDAACGEEGLRVAAKEGVERSGDEGKGWVRGAGQERYAVDGQVVGERRDEAAADQFRRLRWEWGGELGGHGSPSAATSAVAEEEEACGCARLTAGWGTPRSDGVLDAMGHFFWPNMQSGPNYLAMLLN